MSLRASTESHYVDRWMDGGRRILPPDEHLACVRDGAVAHLVLNRPTRRNAISVDMWKQFVPLLRQLESDLSVKVIVLRGAGSKAFSAGADISEFAEVYADVDAASDYNAAVRSAQLTLERLEKPTLAVVHGACVGGGFGIALACDMRFAADDARFGITASKLGVGYSVPDTRRLVALVGPSRAKDILYSGRLVEAPEALTIGVVDRVTPGSELESAAAVYARVLVNNSSQAIRTAKRIINSVAGIHPESEACLDERFASSFGSADFREGYSAFLEKREAKFE